MRTRIGKKQRDILTRLDLVGPFFISELSRNDRRGVLSLARQGKVKLFKVGPLIEARAVEPDNG